VENRSQNRVRIQGLAFLIFFFLLPAIPGWSTVFFRWTEPELPPARALGVTDLVIPWSQINRATVENARRHGYHLFAEVAPGEVGALDAGAVAGFSGIVVKVGEAGKEPAGLNEQLAKLQSENPELKVLLLGQDGTQPQLRGSMVVKNNGILQVSSPTEQPWIDSNIALIRYGRAVRPSQPPLVRFRWEFPDASDEEGAPTAADYALAVAEAGASRADLILDVDPKLQRALLEKRPDGWETWNQVKQYVLFYSHNSESLADPVAEVGVVTADYETSYEPTNLMARHNIPFRVLTPRDLDAGELRGMAVLAVFSPPDERAQGVIERFAEQGGTAVLAGLKGSYPWHSSTPVTETEQAVTYRIGAGKIVELAGPVADPETFAEDVRRLLPRQEVWFRLWNALTTLGTLYRQPRSPDYELDLVNYLQEPLRVQVRVKGSFASVRYETPEHGCCQPLPSTVSNGFTEFIVPDLAIGGRVHLGAARRKHPSPQAPGRNRLE
jgi:hypothetical protein